MIMSAVQRLAAVEQRCSERAQRAADLAGVHAASRYWIADWTQASGAQGYRVVCSGLSSDQPSLPRGGFYLSVAGAARELEAWQSSAYREARARALRSRAEQLSIDAAADAAWEVQH